MFFTYNSLIKYTEIAHFCTDRNGGASMGNYASFNMSPFSGDDPVNVTRNRLTLCVQLGIGFEKLIIPFQTHGTEIIEIDNSFLKLPERKKTQLLYGIDGLITRLPGVCIGITTADCVPLIFFDPQKQVIAVAHAGWRGTCARIGKKTILSMVEKFGCNPANILVVIGPSISPKVYEVGKEVVDKFEQSGFDNSVLVTIRNQSFYLDLWMANRLTLEEAGVLPENIETSGICTFTEHERFFSARRLGIKSGRILSGIMLKG
jgi:YfiH family protein